MLHRRQTATITNGSSYFHWRIWVIIIFRAARVYSKILCSAARTPLAIFQWTFFFSIFVSLVVFMANCKEIMLRIAHIRTKCIRMKKIPTKNKYQFDCHESNFDWIGSAKRYWGWQMFMCLTKIDFKLISYKWNENNACSSVQW